MKIAFLLCMVSIKFLTTFLLLLSTTSAAHAQNEASCYEKAEGQYAYQTETLIHIYETARISPKEFEKLRQELIDRRESSLDQCEEQFNADMDKMVENIQLTTTVHERSLASTPSAGSRAPASLSVPENTFQRGAYTEIGPSSDYESENIPEYNGERIRIGN